MTSEPDYDLVPVQFCKIHVVPVSDPTSEGRWIDCGPHRLPKTTTFPEAVRSLQKYCPSDCVVVAVRLKRW